MVYVPPVGFDTVVTAVITVTVLFVGPAASATIDELSTVDAPVRIRCFPENGSGVSVFS